MKLSPLYLQKLSEATQQGIEQERTNTLTNILRYHYGQLDPELNQIIESMIKLSSEEYSLLLLQISTLSRDQLIARFTPDEV